MSEKDTDQANAKAKDIPRILMETRRENDQHKWLIIGLLLSFHEFSHCVGFCRPVVY